MDSSICIIDLGTEWTRAGVAGERLPAAIEPSVVNGELAGARALRELGLTQRLAAADSLLSWLPRDILHLVDLHIRRELGRLGSRRNKDVEVARKVRPVADCPTRAPTANDRASFSLLYRADYPQLIRFAIERSARVNSACHGAVAQRKAAARASV